MRCTYCVLLLVSVVSFFLGSRLSKKNNADLVSKKDVSIKDSVAVEVISRRFLRLNGLS